MKPSSSYIIWFSQRTGSTLLHKALESTGVAGNPAEWLPYPIPNTFSIQNMWTHGTTSNGVFGVEISPANFDKWIDLFRDDLQLPDELSPIQVLNEAFPNCKHIFMTRRNKVRLAVSWWRAIVSGEWHRERGTKPLQAEIEDKYNFDAINHLFIESSMREAGMQALFSEGNIVPLTIVYEDFIQNYEETVMQILEYLDIPTENVQIECPFFDPIADDIAESWVQRFRQERQEGWDNIGW